MTLRQVLLKFTLLNAKIIDSLFALQLFFKCCSTLPPLEQKPGAYIKKDFHYDHLGFRVSLPCWLAWLRSPSCKSWRADALSAQETLYNAAAAATDQGGHNRREGGALAVGGSTLQRSAPTTLLLRKVATSTDQSQGEVCSDFDFDPDEEEAARQRGKKAKRGAQGIGGSAKKHLLSSN